MDEYARCHNVGKAGRIREATRVIAGRIDKRLPYPFPCTIRGPIWLSLPYRSAALCNKENSFRFYTRIHIWEVHVNGIFVFLCYIRLSSYYLNICDTFLLDASSVAYTCTYIFTYPNAPLQYPLLQYFN